MNRRRLGSRLALLVLLGSVALGRGAAAGDDKLLWGLDEGLYRFDLVEESPTPWFDGSLTTQRVLRGSDFEERKHLARDVAGCADIAWFLALSLPIDAGRDGPTEVIKTLHLSSSLGAVRVWGWEELEHSPGAVALKATLQLAQVEPGAQLHLAPGCTIKVERTFDLKTGTIPEARFDLTLNTNDGKSDATERHVGRVVLRGKVDPATKAFLREIDATIQRGAAMLKDKLTTSLAFLKASPNKTDYAPGKVGVETLALLRSGVPAAELKDAFDFMARSDFTEVYSVSLYVLCLDARSVRRIPVPPTDGGHAVARFRKEQTPDKDKKEMARAVAWLLAAHKAGMWSYHGAGATNAGQHLQSGDRSNTQFAALAVHCASLSGVPVEPDVFAEIADELWGSQEPASQKEQHLRDVVWTPAAPAGIAPVLATGADAGPKATPRGWDYDLKKPCPAGQAYGSMTSAGISSAAIAREGLRRAGKLGADLDGKTKRELLDGLAWFVANWTPAQNPNASGKRAGDKNLFYYLYSVEKAMETAGVESFGGHEWWREGCVQLLGLEEKPKAGSWGDAADTALALLFLNRATLPARLVVLDRSREASGENDPNAWDEIKVEGTGYVHLEQVLEALDTATGKDAHDLVAIAEKGVEAVPEEVRPRLASSLAALLAAADKDVRRFAQKALRSATGLDDETNQRAAASAVDRYKAFADRWREIERAADSSDYAAIPRIRAALAGADSTLPLKRGALAALVRLGAVEALGDVIAELGNPNPAYRQKAAAACVALAGGERRPFDAKAPDAERARQAADWKTWWDENSASLVRDEDARRSVQMLSSADGKVSGLAEAKLRALGKSAVPFLIDALLDARIESRARGLLREITQQDLPDRAAWLAWWEKAKG